jgi:outer membrane receptor for ferrienterochelin and colicin
VYARFDDRQLSVATCAGIVGCPSTLVNVGKVDTKGVEAIAVWKFNREISWFNSYTFNDSKYKSNYGRHQPGGRQRQDRGRCAAPAVQHRSVV